MIKEAKWVIGDGPLKSLAGPEYRAVCEALCGGGWFYNGTHGGWERRPSETEPQEVAAKRATDTACQTTPSRGLGAAAPAPSTAFPQVPRIYDISVDEFRPVTQADVDRWAEFEQGFGRFVGAVDEARQTLRNRVLAAGRERMPGV